MALLPWDDEDQKKQDELFNATPVKTVASVQSGSWQPAPSGADAPATQGVAPATDTGGIFDQQPAQTNYLLSDEKAQVDEQKRQRDAQIAEARRQAAIRQAQAHAAAQAQAHAQAQASAAQAQAQPARPKYLPAHAKGEGGIKGFFKGIGAGIEQGLGAAADVAIKGGAVVSSIGANDKQLAARLAATERIRNWLFSQKDITGHNLVGTQDVEEQAARISSGKGSLRDYATVGGKGLQVGIDSTMFLNPARLATGAAKSAVAPVVAESANILSKTAANPAVRYAMRDAAFFGSLQGTATFQRIYGETGDVTKALESAAQDAIVGGALQGSLDVAGHGVGVGANRTINSLRPGKELPRVDVDSLGNLLEEGGQVSKTTTPPAETPNTLPQTVADGVVLPERPTPVADGNVQFDTPETVTPAVTPELPTAVADGVAPATDVPTVDTPAPEVAPASITPDVPANVAPVADGVVQPNEVAPVRDKAAPASPDEVRALEDSRAGKSQADEAAINQQLQEIKNQTPANHFKDETEISQINRILENKDTVAGGQKIADYYREAKGEDWHTEDMTPDQYLDRAAKAMDSTDPQGWRGAHTGNVEKYSSDMKNGDKFPMPWINEVAGSQEGRTRALAAKAAGQKTIKVAVASKYNPERYAERVKYEADMAHNQKMLDMLNGKSVEKPVPENIAPIKESTNVPKPEPENVTPVKEDSLPKMEEPSDGKLTPAQVSERTMPKLADNSDLKGHVADTVGMSKDKESPIRDILRDGGVKPAQAERIASHFDRLDEQMHEYNRLQETNQKTYAEGGTEKLDKDVSKARSRAGREIGITTRRLLTEIKRLEGHRDKQIALIHNLTDIVGERNANVLFSAGLLERNVFQELTANIKLAVKNPIKMTKSLVANGNILGDTAKSELSHWADKPSINPIEVVKYVVGNAYRTAMIPTTALANVRRGAVRDELTKWAYQALEGRKVSSSEAHKLAGTAGNEMEALVNTVIGADNGMTNRGQAKRALDAWKEYIKSGDDGAKSEYLKHVEEHSSLADQMIAGLSKEDAKKANALKIMGNLIFPFVRTAKNLTITAVKQDLNPFAKSLLDEIGADQRSGTANAINTIKSKLVDYGIMGGAAALAGSGMLVYSDGDDVDKPRGWSVKIGDDKFVPVRATSLELPLALAGTAEEMATDIAAGKARDWKYYAGMVTGSLPYIDQINITTGAVDSLMNGEDAGYAAKSYGVNMAKSFVPGSNNSIQPYVAGKKGESLNAKTVYDKDSTWQWFKNAVEKSYNPDFYNGLKDSRDNAGRVRTVDNQGVISHKNINDPSTKEFNSRITELVNYGREAGIGKNTQDMFNTYPDGKDNNFKSIHDAITFLDVADGGKPDNAKKLEKNGKLADLSQQIREGFYGDTGSELLTLDGQNLKSDASVPNKAGSKNSKLPMSMQSIKNAIAQTDLPKDQSDKLYEISQQGTDLYNKLKAKSITYDQYSAAKSQLGSQEIGILSNSKSYQKMLGLFDELDHTGFFKSDGLGATKSGQTYLWNSLNALLGAKGTTPATNYPDTAGNGFTPWGRGGGGSTGRGATNKPGDRKNTGIQWTPAGKRQMASVASAKYTPVNIRVKLGNAVKKDRSQNYSDRSF